MRLRNHDRLNYLHNKRIAVIQKAYHTIHMQCQLINNRLIDKWILESESEVPTTVYNPYKLSNIEAELIGYNTLATRKEWNRILSHSVIARNPQTRLEAGKVLNAVSGDLTTIEAERIVKNLNYMDNVINTVNVDIGKYERLVERLPDATSRKDVIERCILNDQSLPPTRRQAWLERNLERGASYNKQYSYKELNQLSRDLERYKTNRLDYEKAIMENRQAQREGYSNVNQEKTWIWSTLENTRHMNMDGETIPLTAKFEVMNEQTGDIDYLLYPGDVANDHNNCSNICNCQCSYTIQ